MFARTLALSIALFFLSFASMAQAEETSTTTSPVAEAFTPDAVVVGALHGRSLDGGGFTYVSVGPRWVLAANDRFALLTGADFQVAPVAGNWGFFFPLIGGVTINDHLGWNLTVGGIVDVADKQPSVSSAVSTGPLFTIGKYKIPLAVGTGFNSGGWSRSFSVFTGVVIPLP